MLLYHIVYILSSVCKYIFCSAAMHFLPSALQLAAEWLPDIYGITPAAVLPIG
jgi:hypothetical protein